MRYFIVVIAFQSCIIINFLAIKKILQQYIRLVLKHTL